MNSKIFGDYNREEPPVPIPNTEVKLSSADDTWLETARENRSSPNFYSSIAQSVEHAAVNRRVVGSSPTWGAKRNAAQMCSVSLYGRYDVPVVHFIIQNY